MLATVTALAVSSIESILEAMSRVAGYTAAPVTALFLLGVLTRRGHFWAWVMATLAVALPLSIYAQNFAQVHWVFYHPISLVSCLAAAYLLSLIMKPVWKYSPEGGELSIWRNRG